MYWTLVWRVPGWLIASWITRSWYNRIPWQRETLSCEWRWEALSRIRKERWCPEWQSGWKERRWGSWPTGKGSLILICPNRIVSCWFSLSSAIKPKRSRFGITGGRYLSWWKKNCRRWTRWWSPVCLPGRKKVSRGRRSRSRGMIWRRWVTRTWLPAWRIWILLLSWRITWNSVVTRTSYPKSRCGGARQFPIWRENTRVIRTNRFLFLMVSRQRLKRCTIWIRIAWVVSRC